MQALVQVRLQGTDSSSIVLCNISASGNTFEVKYILVVEQVLPLEYLTSSTEVDSYEWVNLRGCVLPAASKSSRGLNASRTTATTGNNQRWPRSSHT